MEPIEDMRNFSLPELVEHLKHSPIDLSIGTNRLRLRHYLERLVQYEKFAQACNDARAHLPHDLPDDWSSSELDIPARADTSRDRSVNHALHCARIVERNLGNSTPATTAAEDWWNLKLALDALDMGV